MINPLVSVLIPNYNKEYFLRETLDSILNQTYDNWECIVVDDHSTDKSWEILTEFAKKDRRFRIYLRPDDLKKGGNVCRNYAFKLSQGDFVNWFDSDDLMDPNLLENRVAILQDKNCDYVIIGGKYFINKIGDVEGFLPPLCTYPNIIESFIIVNPPWTTRSCMYRKEFLIKKKLIWNEKLLGLQDVEFNLKVFSKSDKIVFSYKYCDHHWRLFLDNSSTGGQHFNYKKFDTLFNFINSVSEIVDFSFYYNVIRNISFQFLFNSVKKVSFSWFRKLVFPLYRMNIINFRELIQIVRIMIYYYFDKRNDNKKIIIIDKMRKLLLKIEPNLINSQRIDMPVEKQGFENRMNELNISSNQIIKYEDKEIIVIT